LIRAGLAAWAVRMWGALAVVEKSVAAQVKKKKKQGRKPAFCYVIWRSSHKLINATKCHQNANVYCLVFYMRFQ